MTVNVRQTSKGFDIDVIQFAKFGMDLGETCAAIQQISDQLTAYLAFNRQ